PGHFSGMATVVVKLLLQTLPDYACFGEKDFQQLRIVEQLVRDLSIPTAIVPVPIVRDQDGLALSSRNALLSEEARAVASNIPAVLFDTAEHIRAGQDVAVSLEAGRSRLTTEGFKIDYFELADGKTLELTDSNYKKVTETYTYSGKENGRTVFYNADKSAFAWLSEDEKKVEGTFTYAAENDKFRMLVDQRLANIGLENKETGYIWWSSPLEATRDQVATPLLISELRSSNTLRYGIPERRSNNNVVRSGTDDCTITVSKINNGIKAVYDFQKAGFKYPVEYVLEDDHLKASVKVAEIQESNAANIATELTVLGSFGAADMTEEGYFVVPDGSGALVRFNNQKTMDTNAYQQRVYGSDVTVVPTSKGAVTEQVYLPVYGIVKEDNACLVVASKGDSNAVLSAQVSKQSNSSYNLCSFTFILRGTDTFYMSGNSNDKLTVFESGAIKSDDIELRYYPIAKEGADYTDIAARYRQYLTEEAGVSAKTEAGKSPMYVDLYGGTQKKKPVLGIPVTMKQKITTYDQAGQILSQLKNSGVDDIVVSYNNW
ncbi:MAG TPA: pantoate--beta-alanine ligase, partial [Ruminococcus sp.]|nr:pantoate--beta-alanine ligase [Ruminococcus sp.]